MGWREGHNAARFDRHLDSGFWVPPHPLGFLSNHEILKPGEFHVLSSLEGIADLSQNLLGERHRFIRGSPAASATAWARSARVTFRLVI
jgi:hypothetical protein